ncbi:hypothetical protein TcasGA2_TC032460 [Tribolium castaneum]|uniref:Uncharacterized protein n=1 Tax=Tribolium castaneum TaxID=7070 RepID=A0A139WLK2_TRICA|nr:hypothetical protein TcasGA2_TC032460 [Tribolium castaneum]
MASIKNRSSRLQFAPKLSAIASSSEVGGGAKTPVGGRSASNESPTPGHHSTVGALIVPKHQSEPDTSLVRTLPPLPTDFYTRNTE